MITFSNPCKQPMPHLPWAHGGPPLQVKIRSSAADFIVEEQLGFSPSGEGEHVLLTVRKRDTNTDWLAQQLARHAGVSRTAVSYAGLKDRHALTTQSFSIQLPGQAEPDWSAFPHQEVEILSATRHQRKLKRGALQGNRFELILREISGDRAQARQRLDMIARLGVPNYFGEQRFGLGGRNVERAEAMFQGRRVDRKTRGLLISAARSQIFNAVLATRVTDGSWNTALPGDVFCLDGSRSWFAAEAGDDSLQQRLERADIHPSGPLWGRGELPSRADLAVLETSIAQQYPGLVTGLCAQKLDHDRRPLRLFPQDLEHEWLDDTSLRLCFALPAGAYATVILRELARWDTEAPTRPEGADRTLPV